MKKRILTGDRPSGNLHLGHYVGSLENRVKLQHTYDQYIMIADVQALTDNFKNPHKITQNVFEITKDYLSVGIDPQKTTIFIQSQIPEITELTVYYLNLVNIRRLQRNPSIKYEIQQKGYNGSVPVGFLCYPINQAADITIFQAELVPVGGDQIPMIEQTNEIVRSFNKTYSSNFLKECKAILSTTPRLIGIDGKTKASKSLNNAIFLTDTKEVIKQKIFQMFTDPNHLKITDPGNIEGNVVFSYLEVFHSDKDELEALKAHYKKGGLGDNTIKNILNSTIQELLHKIRERRELIKEKDIKEILYEGTLKAHKLTNLVIEQVREIIGIKYFKDTSLKNRNSFL